MTRTAIWISMLAVVACGGRKPAPAPPKEPEPAPAPVAESQPAASPEPAPEPAPEPPPPPAPKTWRAHAQLNPVRGAKIKGVLVTFAQQEGQAVAIGSAGWFDGIKPGKYHLIVHDGATCGMNASKVGKPMAGGDIPFNAAKDMEGLDIPQVNGLQLDGTAAIVGHTLALHDDRRGKAGKVLACGPITATD